MKCVELPNFLSAETIRDIIDIISNKVEMKQGLAWGFADNVNDHDVIDSVNVPGIVLDLTHDLIEYSQIVPPIPDFVFNSLYELTNQLVSNIVREAEKHDIMLTELHRLRYNVLFGSNVDGHHLPHVDDSVLCERERPHWVGILHLYGDGPTYLFNKSWNGTKDVNMDGTEHKIIDFAPGKLTLFDGNMYHASSSPKNNNWRLVINMNLS